MSTCFPDPANGLSPDRKVLAFGEVLWDLLPDGALLGGAPANCAFRLQNLGIRTSLISRVGTDESGSRALDMLTRSGLDCSFVQRDDVHPTGSAGVQLSAGGSPNFVITRDAAYDFIVPAAWCEADLPQGSLVIFGTLCQRSSLSRDTLYRLLSRASRATKLLDVNLRKDCYTQDIIERSLRAADILKLNEDEVVLLGQMFGIESASLSQFCNQLISRFDLKTCLVTRGEAGVFALNSSGQEVALPGVRVQVADTIGAGDAFTAGFASRLLAGDSLLESCRFGNALGALAASKNGGMAAITTAEIAELIG